MEAPTTPENGCEFCDEFAGGLNNAFYARYEGCLRTRFLMSAENFHVFPTIGQLVEGYLLIVPKKHYAAFDQLSCSLWREFDGLHEHVKKVLSSYYGPCIMYEHGVKRTGTGGCGIYHAHVHALPISTLSDPVQALKATFPYTRLPRPHRVAEYSANLASYLLYQDCRSRTYLFDTGPLPSQYMRKLLAEALGHQQWDWRTVGKEDRLLTTIQQLSRRFTASRET